MHTLWNVYIDDVGAAFWSKLIEAHTRKLDAIGSSGARDAILRSGDLRPRPRCAGAGRISKPACDPRDARIRQHPRRQLRLYPPGTERTVDRAAAGSRDAVREALVMAEDNFGADSGLKALCTTFIGYCLYLKGDTETPIALSKRRPEQPTVGWMCLQRPMRSPPVRHLRAVA